VTEHEPDQATSDQDRGPDAPPVGCTVRVTGSGTVTVRRDHGCTSEDVRELCHALVGGALQIVDLTELDT